MNLFLVTCVFPLAGGPQSSVSCPHINPPPSTSSRQGHPVVITTPLVIHSSSQSSLADTGWPPNWNSKDWRTLCTSSHGSPTLLDSCGAGSLTKSTTVRGKREIDAWSIRINRSHIPVFTPKDFSLSTISSVSRGESSGRSRAMPTRCTLNRM